MRFLRYKDADLARHFLRDSYCNGSWHTFDTLVTLISEGGTIGCVQMTEFKSGVPFSLLTGSTCSLDDKLFTFFWPHGELGSWQGISRFEAGQRIKEFKDQRVNPRSLLESQCESLPSRLCRFSTAHHIFINDSSRSSHNAPPTFSY
jgi:hypothetical protein